MTWDEGTTSSPSRHGEIAQSGVHRERPSQVVEIADVVRWASAATGYTATVAAG
jgi:hypothetical protein